MAQELESLQPLVGDSDGISGSWLQRGPTRAVPGFWGHEPVDGALFFCHPVFQINKNK